MAKEKTTPIKDRQTKAAIVGEIAEATGLSRAEVRAVLLSLATQAHRHLKPGACGEFLIPELGLKMKRVARPARPARMGRNPFTGEEIMIAAKPASRSVRVSALKTAKAMVLK